MLFTDTESLTYEIKSENIYEKFLSGKIYFHFGKILVIIQKIQGFMMGLIKKLLVK